MWSAASVLVGIVIGSGIFRVPSTVAAASGTVGLIALIWVAGGLFALCGALSIAELATMFPRPGGGFVYLHETYGPLPAFLSGWTDLLLAGPAASGAVALIFAGYAGVFVPLGDGGERVVAIALIVLLSAAQIRSVRLGAAIQNASTGAKFFALLLLCGALLLFGDHEGSALTAGSGGVETSWSGVGVALIAVLWTWDGWSNVAALAGEVRDPGKTLPRAILIGLAAVFLVYAAANGAFLSVLSHDAVANSSFVAADAATRVFGTAGAALTAALVMLSTFGGLNGLIMTHARLPYAMAEMDLFFPRVAAVHPRFQTPHVAILISSGLAVAFVAVSSFEQLAATVILAEWPFYALTVAAVLVLRRRIPTAIRPYRTPGYPVVPLLFVVGSLGLFTAGFIGQPLEASLGVAVILGGLPAYYLWRAVGRGRK